MSALRFEWDAVKATLNVRKHGVTFDEAATVFEDEDGAVIRLISARRADRSEREAYANRSP